MSLELTTAISAPPEAVYEVLMDFPSYGDWNPMVLQISGDPLVGSRLEAHIKIGARAPQTFKPVVLKNEPNKEFRWVGTLLAAFLYRGEHYFVIEPTADGCIFKHGEIFSGILEPLLSKMMEKDLQPAFQSFNDAIKRRVEERTQ